MQDDIPLAYKIGDQPFLGLTIYLDSKPLIPRPETEWWTEQLLQKVGGAGGFGRNESRSATAREEAIRQQAKTPLVSSESPAQPMKFLDLCAGSGAIGCAALKYLPSAHVYFGEIDPAHEATIRKNIRENNLDASRAHVCIGDLFSARGGPAYMQSAAFGGVPLSSVQFDIIACNPPYIPTDRVLDASVTDYEPALALRSGTDGLHLIRRIASTVRRRLTVGGEMWLECDTSNIESARDLFTSQGFTAHMRTDQYAVPRLLVVHPVR